MERKVCGSHPRCSAAAAAGPHLQAIRTQALPGIEMDGLCGPSEDGRGCTHGTYRGMLKKPRILGNPQGRLPMCSCLKILKLLDAGGCS